LYQGTASAAPTSRQKQSALTAAYRVQGLKPIR
jgi:hypothetical protein